MSEPQSGGSLGERLNQAIGWLQRRSQTEWIMFGIGIAVGAILL